MRYCIFALSVQNVSEGNNLTIPMASLLDLIRIHHNQNTDQITLGVIEHHFSLQLYDGHFPQSKIDHVFGSLDRRLGYTQYSCSIDKLKKITTFNSAFNCNRFNILFSKKSVSFQKYFLNFLISKTPTYLRLKRSMELYTKQISIF